MQVKDRTSGAEGVVFGERRPVKRRGGIRLVAAALALGAMAMLPRPPVAAEVVPVNFVVHETIPVTQGTLVRGRFDACDKVTITTLHGGMSEAGTVTTFSGSKKFSCGGRNTLTIAFKVVVRGCARSNSGSWEVVRGTGRFATARGRGRLAGSYTWGNAGGTYCRADGINDQYTGELRY